MSGASPFRKPRSSTVPAALVVLWASVAASLSGCAGTQREIWVHRYVFGLFGGGTVDVRDVCATRRAQRVRVSRNVESYALALLTLGVYLPHQVHVECAD